MVATLSVCSSDDSGVDTTRTFGEAEEEKRLCIVEWKDIISCSGWEKAYDVDSPQFVSVGWLISRDGSQIKIASTLDYADAFGDAKDEAKPVPYGITAFPKGCVSKVDYI